ncbi:hypothetical protein DI270_020075 [Microbispora triticiradicis]|uniref:Integrase n=1 Tax=Microbispora triticiradicis TaxID=2200763 RepID=A0ABX9LHF2_9ACTN|nr:hypothetical protein DI270_020075 [Microbispora triticiradicis]
MHDERGLKHRAERETRPIPIPPVLQAILREHIKRYGLADDGRLFRTAKGGPYTASANSHIWQKARAIAFRPEQATSPLAARPYGPAGRRRLALPQVGAC